MEVEIRLERMVMELDLRNCSSFQQSWKIACERLFNELRTKLSREYQQAMQPSDFRLTWAQNPMQNLEAIDISWRGQSIGSFQMHEGQRAVVFEPHYACIHFMVKGRR